MPKPAVDLDIALDAISTDLDAMGEEIATVAGQVAQLGVDQRETTSEVRAVGHKLDHLLDMLRTRILPAVDDVDRLRRRIVFLENPGLQQHTLDGE